MCPPRRVKVDVLMMRSAGGRGRDVELAMEDVNDAEAVIGEDALEVREGEGVLGFSVNADGLCR